MRLRKLITGIWRRLFRYTLRIRAQNGLAKRKAGAAFLAGYGIRMEYPDELIWVNQIMEIFGQDCYGVNGLPEKCYVIDGGANIGSFSLYLKWLRPKANVVAVEPSSENLKYLRGNLAKNGAGDVEILPMALAGKSGTTSIGGTASDAMRTGHRGLEHVEAISLKDIIQMPVDLLKLDIEGAEYDVICSSDDILSLVRRVVIEYHLYDGQVSQLPEILASLRDQAFNRFQINCLRDFEVIATGDIEHCCLIHAWRAD